MPAQVIPGDEAHEEGEGYFASIADLLVGLVFIFIVILVAFALNYRIAQNKADEAFRTLLLEKEQVAQERDRLAEQTERLRFETEKLQRERDRLAQQRDRLMSIATSLAENNDARNDLLTRLKTRMDAVGVDVEVDLTRGVLRLPERLLFASGEAVMREQGVETLALITPILEETLPCYAAEGSDNICLYGKPGLLEAVLIEGHTDNIAYTGSQFRDNWDLSAVRAISTYQQMIRLVPELDTLKNPNGEALLGVSGYEARRPIDLQDNREALARNRRIDLRFLVAAPSNTELDSIVFAIRTSTIDELDKARGPFLPDPTLYRDAPVQ